MTKTKTKITTTTTTTTTNNNNNINGLCITLSVDETCGGVLGIFDRTVLKLPILFRTDGVQCIRHNIHTDLRNQVVNHIHSIKPRKTMLQYMYTTYIIQHTHTYANIYDDLCAGVQTTTVRNFCVSCIINQQSPPPSSEKLHYAPFCGFVRLPYSFYCSLPCNTNLQYIVGILFIMRLCAVYYTYHAHYRRT